MYPIVEGGVVSVKGVFLEFCCVIAFRGDFAGGYTSIVDQYAETLLPLLDLFDEGLDVAFAGDVGDERDNFTRDVFAVILDYYLELLLGAAYNVDLRAIDCKGLSRLSMNHTT